jgi:ADP-heptose:LPS heptosyltransferase
MNVTTLRIIDSWLGIPLCFLLTVIRTIAEKLKRPNLGQVHTILFVKLAEQGATVVAYPAILRAVERVGAENVYFIVFEENRSILDVMDVVPKENVITVPTSGLWTALVGLVRSLLQLRKKKIDTAVDFEFFARGSAIISWLSGAKRRVGLHSFAGEAPYRGNLMTHPVPYNCHLHASQTFRILVESVDAPVEKLPALNLPAESNRMPLPAFRPRPEEVKTLKCLLAEQSGRKNIFSIIILNANASDLLPSRRWPSQNYVELARLLIKKYPHVHIVFTGTTQEAAIVRELVTQVRSKRCLSLAGKTTFRQLMVLYTISNLLITNDSGPAHFAALTPVSVIVLFGPETPELFAPKTARIHVIRSALACSPCISAFNGRRTKCKDNICMKKITVSQVFDEASRVYENSLNKTPARRRHPAANKSQPAVARTIGVTRRPKTGFEHIRPTVLF